MTHNELKCKSEYFTVRDGVRLAVSIWLTEHDRSRAQSYPAVLIATRYWRAMAFKDNAEELQSYYAFAASLLAHGYRLAVADARGTGASFGCRTAETDREEVEDIGELIAWVSGQEWCDGQVATFGVSYSGITTLYSLVTAPSSLKLGVCRAPDFDMYRQLFAPGGIVNRWFVSGWGGFTAGKDTNDMTAIYANGYAPLPEGGIGNIIGVRPVDEDLDGSLLRAAVAEHQSNFNIAAPNSSVESIDHFLSETNPPVYDPAFKKRIEDNNIPLVVRGGWHDGGVALGAVSLFASIHSPMKIILGPWNHDGTYHVDPFQEGDGTTPLATPITDARALVIQSLDEVFYPERNGESPDGHSAEEKPKRFVEYYTLGENRWKITEQWPLPQAKNQRLYLSDNHKLTAMLPGETEGSDQYIVDPTASTGRFNRWHAQASNQPVHFPDRKAEDKKLLIYDTDPLEKDTEITGHSVVTLYLRSSATDGQFFVYLETIDPDGRVRLLNDGQLRGIHRKISNEAEPYKMFGPYHSLLEKDVLPIVPGEVTEISFDLNPMSVLLQKGQRIRIAIAGADIDTFAPIEGCENPELIIERNSLYASCIDLPIV